MINRVNIYFEDEGVRKDLEVFARKQDMSFSRAVLECAGAGLSLFKRIGSLNIDLLMEKVNRLEEAKTEIEFLRRIIDSNLPIKLDKGIQEALPLEKKQPVGEAFRTSYSSKKYRRIDSEKKDKT